MRELPLFLELEAYLGADDAERWPKYIEGLYTVYLRTVAHGKLNFLGLPVRCQFRPETFGKHYAFWHYVQEGVVEDERTVDIERCRRVAWIAWVIQEAGTDSRVRVFPQRRGSEQSWALWLHAQDYAVILHERNDYWLLKTAFVVRPHKRKELERDWIAYENC